MTLVVLFIEDHEDSRQTIRSLLTRITLIRWTMTWKAVLFQEPG